MRIAKFDSREAVRIALRDISPDIVLNLLYGIGDQVYLLASDGATAPRRDHILRHDNTWAEK